MAWVTMACFSVRRSARNSSDRSRLANAGAASETRAMVQRIVFLKFTSGLLCSERCIRNRTRLLLRRVFIENACDDIVDARFDLLGGAPRLDHARGTAAPDQLVVRRIDHVHDQRAFRVLVHVDAASEPAAPVAAG